MSVRFYLSFDFKIIFVIAFLVGKRLNIAITTRHCHRHKLHVPENL